MALISDLAKDTLKLRQTHFPRGGSLKQCKLCSKNVTEQVSNEQCECTAWAVILQLTQNGVGMFWSRTLNLITQIQPIIFQ